MRFFKLPIHFWSDIEAKYHSRQTSQGSRKAKYNLEKLSVDLGKFVDRELNEMNHNLWVIYKSRGEKPGYGDNNLSKLKSFKDFTPARDLIDLLCYYSYGKAYIKCVNDGDIQENSISEYLLLKSQRDTEDPILENQNLYELRKKDDIDEKEKPQKEPLTDKDFNISAQTSTTATGNPSSDKAPSDVELGLIKYKKTIELHEDWKTKKEKTSHDSHLIIEYGQVAVELLGYDEIEKAAELKEIIRQHKLHIQPENLRDAINKTVAYFARMKLFKAPRIYFIIAILCITSALLSQVDFKKLTIWPNSGFSNLSQKSLPDKPKPDQKQTTDTSAHATAQNNKTVLSEEKKETDSAQKYVADPVKINDDKPDKKIINPPAEEIRYFRIGDYSHIGSTENWKRSFVKEDLTNDDDNSIQNKDFTAQSPVFYREPADTNNPFPINKGIVTKGLVRFRVIDILPIASPHTFNLSLIYVKVKILSK